MSFWRRFTDLDARRRESDIPRQMDKRIQIDPAICHGKPVIRGTRVLVSTLLGALSGGDSIEAVLEDYPSVTREDVSATLGLS